MIIYKATNLINGKVYIGQTRQKLARRIDQHFSRADNSNRSSYFINAIRKYKRSDFIWVILSTEESIEQLNEKEKYFIKLFKSDIKEYGYNLESGGNCKIIVSESTRKKLSENAIKKGISPDNFKKMLAAKKKYNRKRKPMSEECKRKISVAHKGRIISPEQREKARINSTGKHPSEKTKAKLRLVQQGAKGYWAKITELQAIEILNRLKNGEKQADLAREFNITDGAIYRMKTGKNWSHLTV